MYRNNCRAISVGSPLHIVVVHFLFFPFLPVISMSATFAGLFLSVFPRTVFLRFTQTLIICFERKLTTALYGVPDSVRGGAPCKRCGAHAR
jgi:hypothetical protein